MHMIKSLILILSVLLSVAFITLLERKILSFSQSRKGPNLVGPLGLLQPFSDGMKLLTKEQPLWGNNLSILLPPFLFWSSALIFWMGVSTSQSMFNMVFFWVLVLSSFGGIICFLTGWNGKSSYSILGGIRASAQVISYEVILSFIFLMSLMLVLSLSMKKLESFPLLSSYWFFGVFCIPLWLLTILAETNRAPFDLTEGESELVSGFNTEYSSLSFTFLFLAEYSLILGFSFLTSLMFFSSWKMSILVVCFILWIRSCFPRKRYDHLMELMWVYLFPLVILLISLQILVFLS